MRLVLISDSHSLHESYGTLPEGDVLVFAGDFTTRGSYMEAMAFAMWFRSQPHKYKVCIAGNHDKCMRSMVLPEFKRDMHYLENDSIMIEGLRFWGSPWTPYFANLAFEYQRGDQARTIWNHIPSDVDVLITHGPPYGILDKTYRGDHPGCKELLKRVQDVKPKLHVFGHIHEAYGQILRDKTLYINASNHNMLWKKDTHTPPIVIDLDTR